MVSRSTGGIQLSGCGRKVWLARGVSRKGGSEQFYSYGLSGHTEVEMGSLRLVYDAEGDILDVDFA
jgi:hypothetical protein